MQRHRVPWAFICTLLALMVAAPGCDDDTDPLPTSVNGQWDWTVLSGDCGIQNGILDDPQNFFLSQSGDQVNASFTDSNGYQVNIAGHFRPSGFCAIMEVSGKGLYILAKLSFNARYQSDGDREMTGTVTILEDSGDDCSSDLISVYMEESGSTAPSEVFEQCGPVDVVFMMDTSGSMEDEAAALCSQIDDVFSQMAGYGLTDYRVFKWGITEDAGLNSQFPCLTDHVKDIFGDPIVPGTTNRKLNLNDSDEDWGPGTAIVSHLGSGGRNQNFQWRPDAIKILIPISDEGPSNGDPSDDQDDADLIANAITQAKANGVIVSPIIGTDAEVWTSEHARDLAEGTSGVAFRSVDPDLDLGQLVYDIVFVACGGKLEPPDPPLSPARPSWSPPAAAVGSTPSTRPPAQTPSS